MFKLGRKRKSNNNGSTIVIVLIMASFIMILATVITTATMMNLKMKMAGKSAKNTFYTSEAAVDEIYAALGKISVECFNAAYEEELAQITSYIVYENGYPVSTVKVDNNLANLQLRRNYTMRMLSEVNVLEPGEKNQLTNTTIINKYLRSGYIFPDVKKNEEEPENTEGPKDRFVKELNSYLENKNITIKSIDGLNVVIGNTQAVTENNITNMVVGGSGVETYDLVFTNCVVEYINNDNYYSYITFNGRVGLPDTIVNFTDVELRGAATFGDYSLIGNKGVDISGGVSVYNSSVYAGRVNGLKVNNNANLSYSGGNLVTSGTAYIDGGTLVSDGDLWCDNIDLTGTGSILSASGNVYAKDDLQINADDCSVTLSGNYYGYGYETNVGLTHVYSSSMVINGKNANLDFSSLSRLILAGRSYITFNDSQGHSVDVPMATGESFSLIGDQEMYLIPSALIKNGINPMPVASKDDFALSDSFATDFFGFSLLEATPEGKYYITRTVDGRVYHYLNFKNNAALLAYTKLILDEDAFKTFINTDSFSETQRTKAVALRKNIIATVNLNETTNGMVTGAGTETVIKSGHLYSEVNESSTATLPKTNQEVTYSEYFNTYFNDLSCRYTVLSRILLDINYGGYLNSAMLETPAVITANPDLSGIANYTDYDVFYNLISSIGFEKNTDLAARDVEVVSGFHLVAYNNSNNPTNAYVIGSGTGEHNISGGVVVVSGDVVVKQNFDGVIFSNGTIYVKDGVSCTNSYSIEEIEELIAMDGGTLTSTGARVYFKDIFRIWTSVHGSSESEENASIAIGNLTYKDMVTFSEWRKSEYVKPIEEDEDAE